MNTILLIGATGQLGQALKQSLNSAAQLHIADRKDISLDGCPDSINEKLNRINPQIIVNAAAYTNVEQATQEANLVYATNTNGPYTLARWAQKNNALLCHYSSNYIFNGKKHSPYLESDSADPLSVYGQSKWLGDQAVSSTLDKHLIFRVGWIYSSYGNNFIKKMLHAAHQKQKIFVVNDQIGTPTAADWIAEITTKIVKRYIANPNFFPFGTYHLSPKGETSCFQFAKKIFQIAEHVDNQTFRQVIVYPTSTKKFVKNAWRPENARLNCRKLFSTFSLEAPCWTKDLPTNIKEIIIKNFAR